MDLYESTFNIWHNNSRIFYEIEYMLLKKRLNIPTIKKILQSRNLDIDDYNLNLIIYTLLSSEKKIIKHDNWDILPEFEFLDKYYWDSSYQKSQYSLKCNTIEKRTFLLISDTHIGSEIFDSKILHSIYDYAIKKRIRRCFHLGDLFEGNQAISKSLSKYYTSEDIKNLNSFEEELKRQISIFMNEYPKPTEEELTTYAIIGNHDSIINRFLQTRDWWCACDLRKLSIYNPSFYMYPRERITTDLNNVAIHFNHRLYISGVIDDMIVNGPEDIEKDKELLGSILSEPYYEFMICGHLHRGMFYSKINDFTKNSNLYAAVPSTTKVNINNAIAYTVTIDENKVAEITVLGCDSNYNIYEIESFTFEFGAVNPQISKIL